MVKTTFIYAHLEPLEDEIRYIGKSDDPKSRLSSHLSKAPKTRTHHANWLTGLIAIEQMPRLEIIAEVLVEDWEFWERHFIKKFKDYGFLLTNGTIGGDGAAGLISRRVSPETRVKISKTLTGRRMPPKTRAAMIASNTGRRLSANTIDKRTEALRLAPGGYNNRTLESRRKMSISQCLRWAKKKETQSTI